MGDFKLQLFGGFGELRNRCRSNGVACGGAGAGGAGSCYCMLSIIIDVGSEYKDVLKMKQLYIGSCPWRFLEEAQSLISMICSCFMFSERSHEIINLTNATVQVLFCWSCRDFKYQQWRNGKMSQQKCRLHVKPFGEASPQHRDMLFLLLTGVVFLKIKVFYFSDGKKGRESGTISVP